MGLRDFFQDLWDWSDLWELWDFFEIHENYKVYEIFFGFMSYGIFSRFMRFFWGLKLFIQHFGWCFMMIMMIMIVCGLSWIVCGGYPTCWMNLQLDESSILERFMFEIDMFIRNSNVYGYKNNRVIKHRVIKTMFILTWFF